MAVAGRVDSLLEYQDTTNQRVSTFPLKIVGYVPLYDIVILERLDITITLSDNFHVLPYSIEGSDLIPTGTPVMSLGFPHAGHGRLVLTQQSTMVGARVLLGSGGLKIKHVVLNTQTRPGQSGGPVFSADGKRVCAMILGGYSPIGGGGIMLGDVDPQTLHQTTHAVSAEYISEVL